MKKILLSFILLAAMGGLYGQDLTIFYSIEQTNATQSTVTLKMRNNTLTTMEVGAVNFSIVYATTGASGNIANYNSIGTDEFEAIWPAPSLTYKVQTNEPLGASVSRGGDSYNGRWQYGNTDPFGTGTTYSLTPGVKQTVMTVLFDITGITGFYVENESENNLNQIASDDPLVTIAYDVDPENSPFPVEWLSFDAKQMTNSLIQLDWETANETNNSHFDIERSTDNLLYSKVGEVRGSGSIDYNQQYAFTDSVVRAKVYYYRLRQVDMDGQFEYSDVRQVEFTEMNLINLQVYPNPAYDWVYVEGQIDGQEVKDLIITDMTGRVIYRKNMNDLSDFKFDVDLSRFTPGIYNITIMDGYGQAVSSNRFIKK